MSVTGSSITMDNIALEIGPPVRAENGDDTPTQYEQDRQDDANTTNCVDRCSEGNSGEQNTDERNSLLFLRKFFPSRGMLVALLGAIFFTAVDISVEIATQKVDPILVLCLYSSLIFVLSSTALLTTKSKPPTTIRQFVYLLICSGFYAAGATCITLAISKIPVGDAVSIVNSMPIFAGVFGWIFLRQSFRVIDVLFCILCITGVTLIARPSFIFPNEGVNPGAHDEFIGALYAIASACALAASFIAGRKLQDLNVRLFYILLFNSFSTFTFNAILCSTLDLFSAPSPSYYWAIVFAPGVFEFFAQLTVFRAFTMERAVIVTIVLTSEIIFTFTLQILLVGITPHWYSAIGATCILITCVGMATRKEEHIEEEAA